MNALNAAQRMQMIEKFETLTIKEYGELVSENEQLRQRVAEWKEVAEENLKGMAICKQRVAELEKERDEEIARNRPLRNLIASLEEQKSHWNKQRDEYKEAVSTMDSERSANATLTAERDALLEANRVACEDLVERHDRIAELKQQRDELLAALTYVIEDLELRASLKEDEDERDVVDIGNGAYTQAKEALAIPTDSTQVLAEVRRAERERVAQFVDDNCTYGDTHILVKAIRAME